MCGENEEGVSCREGSIQIISTTFANNIPQSTRINGATLTMRGSILLCTDGDSRDTSMPSAAWEQENADSGNLIGSVVVMDPDPLLSPPANTRGLSKTQPPLTCSLPIDGGTGGPWPVGDQAEDKPAG